MKTARAGSVKPILVLGLGNILLRDDGFGPTLVERLRAKMPEDEDVEFADGGTIGLGLLKLLAEREAVLLLDAFRAGLDPGELVVRDRFDPTEAGPTPGRSAHEGNAAALLGVAAFTGDLPRRLAVIGVEPGEIVTGWGLTAEVEESLERAEREALRLIAEMREACSCV